MEWNKTKAHLISIHRYELNSHTLVCLSENIEAASCVIESVIGKMSDWLMVPLSKLGRGTHSSFR